MSVQNVSTSYTDHAAELAALDRKRQLALMLQNQALQPSDAGGMVGQVYVPQSPLQGMAKMLQMYSSGRMLDNLDEQQKDIGARQNAGLADALNKYQSDRGGQPAIESPPDALGGGPARPAAPGNPMAAALGLVSHPDPRAQQLGIALMPKDQKEPEDFTLAPGAGRYSPDGRLIASAPNAEKPAPKSGLAQLIEEMNTLPPGSPMLATYQNAIKKETALQNPSGGNPFFQFLPTADGYRVGDARTGSITTPAGAPVIPAPADPNLKRKMAEAQAGGKVTGESQAEAAINLPQATEGANMAIKQIDDLLAHPGFSSTVGATLTPGARFVEGTKQSDFMKRLDQLKGGAFLQAFESLKGGGQITEIEGKKATDAITRMDKAQSENEFINAAREFQGVIRKGVERAKTKAGSTASIDALLNKYK